MSSILLSNTLFCWWISRCRKRSGLAYLLFRCLNQAGALLSTYNRMEWIMHEQKNEEIKGNLATNHYLSPDPSKVPVSFFHPVTPVSHLAG